MRKLFGLALLGFAPLSFGACGGKAYEGTEPISPPTTDDAGALSGTPSDSDAANSPPASEASSWTIRLSGFGVNVLASDGAGGVYLGDLDITRVNAAGTVAWSTSAQDLWPSPSPNISWLGAVSADAQGNAVVAGYGISLLAQADGHALWTVNVQASEQFEPGSVVVLPDGTIAYVGTFIDSVTFAHTTLSASGINPFLARFDSNGNVLGLQLWSGFTADSASTPMALLDAAGHLVLMSNSELTVLDPALNVIDTIPLVVPSQSLVGFASDGSLYEAVVGPTVAPYLDRFAPGSVAVPTWTVAVGSATTVPGSSQTVIGIAGASGAIVWSDGLSRVDPSGNATVLESNSALEAEVDAVVGQPGDVFAAGWQRPVVIDAQGSLFLCGEMATTATGGGDIYAFLKKKAHP